MYLLNFARACKYRMEQIKRKIDMFMSMRAAIPEYFSGWDPYKPEVQEALQLGYIHKKKQRFISGFNHFN